jgi:hypothetical protein
LLDTGIAACRDFSPRIFFCLAIFFQSHFSAFFGGREAPFSWRGSFDYRVSYFLGGSSGSIG